MICKVKFSPCNRYLKSHTKWHICLDCTGSISWSEWTNCSVTIGTGIQMRYKTSIQKDNETGKIECVQLSESKYCQMIDRMFNFHKYAFLS